MDYTDTPIRMDFKYTDDTKMSGSLRFYYVLDLISEIKEKKKATEVIGKSFFLTRNSNNTDINMLLDNHISEGEEIEILY